VTAHPDKEAVHYLTFTWNQSSNKIRGHAREIEII